MKLVFTAASLCLAMLPTPSLSQQSLILEQCHCKAPALASTEELGPRLRLLRLSQNARWAHSPKDHADMSVPIPFTPHALTQIGRECRHAMSQGPHS